MNKDFTKDELIVINELKKRDAECPMMGVHQIIDEFLEGELVLEVSNTRVQEAYNRLSPASEAKVLADYAKWVYKGETKHKEE